MKDAEEGANKAFDASNAPKPGPPREVSREERAGVKDTDTNPEPALGVGESINERAEDVARRAAEKAGGSRDGTKGASGRPYGSGGASEGVDPNPSVTPGSPDLPPGDQGG